MHILLVSSYFYPEVTGTGAHCTHIAQYLKDRGHKVTIFTPLPHYPQWKIFREYRGRLFLREEYEGIEIFRSWIYLRRGSQVTVKTRLLAELSSVLFQGLHLLRHLRRVRKVDRVIVVSPFFSQGFLGVLLKKLLGRPFIFHVEDILPDSALDAGVLKGSSWPVRLWIRLASWSERMFYRQALAVSTLTPAMRENILRKSPDTPVVLAGLWADLDRFRPSLKLREEFRRKHGYSPDDLVIGYSGNIGKKQNLGALVDLAAEFSQRDPRIKILIAGDGAGRPEVEQRLKHHRLENVRLLPLQPEEEYLAFLNGVDLSYVSQREDVRDAFIPSKLYPTLASGCPVLCLANPLSELYRLLKESKGALVYSWDQREQIVRDVVELVEQRQTLDRLRVGAREYACVAFSREKALEEFVQILEVGTSAG